MCYNSKLNRVERVFSSSRSRVEISLLVSNGRYVASAEHKKPCTISIWDMLNKEIVYQTSYRNGNVLLDGIVLSSSSIVTFGKGIVHLHEWRKKQHESSRCIIGRRIKNANIVDRRVYVVCERSAYVLQMTSRGVLRKYRVVLGLLEESSSLIGVTFSNRRFFLASSFCIYDMGYDGRKIERKFEMKEEIVDVRRVGLNTIQIGTSCSVSFFDVSKSSFTLKWRSTNNNNNNSVVMKKYIGNLHAIDMNGNLMKLVQPTRHVFSFRPFLPDVVVSHPYDTISIIKMCPFFQRKRWYLVDDDDSITHHHHHQKYHSSYEDIVDDTYNDTSVLIANPSRGHAIAACFVVDSSTLEIVVYKIPNLSVLVVRRISFVVDNHDDFSPICCGAFDNIHQRIALGTRNGSVLILNEKYQVTKYLERIHKSRIVSIHFDVQGRYVRTASRSACDVLVSDLMSSDGRAVTHYNIEEYGEKPPQWVLSCCM
jgi:hypothetical protein